MGMFYRMEKMGGYFIPIVHEIDHLNCFSLMFFTSQPLNNVH